MAEQTTKRERLRKTVQEFYALQSPKFRPDAESWMQHIRAVYGEEGHPDNGKTGDIQKRRTGKRGIVQSSDEERSIGKKAPLGQEGIDSSSDEDTSNLRPTAVFKDPRMPTGIAIDIDKLVGDPTGHETTTHDHGEGGIPVSR
jgi:hypothetical protein